MELTVGRARGIRSVSVDERRADLLCVLAWALALRLVFSLLASNTYDPDEFVFLGLSRSFAHGAVPYRDFMFLHPPGILVFLRTLQPLIDRWWPVARLLPLLADTVTAALTWRLGRLLYGRRGGLAAGLLYGASPLATVAAVRVGPDPLVTMLGVAGLVLLVTGSERPGISWRSVLAGACLALAFWTKYPALLFLPVYVLAAPRRAPTVILSAAAAAALLFAPFLHDPHAFIAQTVLWQRGRPPMALDLRLHHLIAYWLLLNALAIPALVRALPGCRPPRWLIAGFCAGGAFLLTPQVYYHYLVPVVPFASLLAAPLLLRLTRSVRLALVPAALALTAASALAVSYGDTNWRLAVTASHFSEIHPVVAYLERSTTPDTYVLGDRFEYAYLAGRRSSADYYWNLHTLVRASDLEHRLRGVSVVVATGGWGMYPDGFIEYLTDHPYPQRSLGPANLWLLAATGPTAPRPDGV